MNNNTWTPLDLIDELIEMLNGAYDRLDRESSVISNRDDLDKVVKCRALIATHTQHVSIAQAYQWSHSTQLVFADPSKQATCFPQSHLDLPDGAVCKYYTVVIKNG